MALMIWSVVAIASAAVVYWLLSDTSFDSTKISGQRVIITGTSMGIGEQLAYVYSKLGARVLITARSENLLNKVGAKCEKLGAKQVIVVPGDMTNAADRERVVDTARKEFDGELDQLILNHVYVKQGHWVGSLANMTTIRSTFEVNFFSYVDIASRSADMLIKANGRIGVISSVAGKVPTAAFAFYSAAKFALDGFFSSWRQELEFAETNVSVTNCVLGLIATESALESIRQGYLKKVNESDAASVEESAEFIMRGVTLRKREIYFPREAKVLCYLHKVFPEYIESISGQYTY